MMNIIKATADFEHWLAGQLPIIRQDLALKHQHMAEAAFPFFRATFYRWLQLWHEVCADLAKAPAVLGVGDLHIENFGTWRDEEGRLIWGVNDLDEAWPAPYALDLVRLTASVYVAIWEEHLSLTRRVAADAIEVGYRDGLAAGGKAFILAEDHRAALAGPGQAARSGPILEEAAELTAIHGETARRSTQNARGSASFAEERVPAEEKDRGAWKPRAPAHSRGVEMARSINRPGSKGHPALVLGFGREGVFRANLLRSAGAALDSRTRSMRAFPRALGGAASGAGLPAH
jgi:uncharacterized protein (DUF2252 family)